MRLSGQFIVIIFFKMFFAQIKNTQALFKYLNTPKKHNKQNKQLSFRCKAMNFLLKYRLKKNIVDTKCNQ